MPVDPKTLQGETKQLLPEPPADVDSLIQGLIAALCTEQGVALKETKQNE